MQQKQITFIKASETTLQTMVWFQETGICHLYLAVKNKYLQLAFTIISTTLTALAVRNCSTEKDTSP